MYLVVFSKYFGHLNQFIKNEKKQKNFIFIQRKHWFYSEEKQLKELVLATLIERKNPRYI